MLSAAEQTAIRAAINSRSRGMVWRYTTAILGLVAAIALREAFDPALSDRLPYITLFSAVAFAVWFCGAGPALLIIAIGEVSAEIFFIHPASGFSVSNPPFLLGRLAYLITSVVIVCFGHLAIKSEKMANEQRLQLQLAQEIADSGFYEWELGHPSATWSKEFRALFGVSSETPASLELGLQIVHPDDRARVREAVNALLESKSNVFEITHRIIRPDGKMRWVLSRAKVVRGNRAGTYKLVGQAIDITEQKAAEAALLRSEKLLAANRMASTLAHELNNPLQGLLGILYLVQSDSALSAESRKMVAKADSEIRRLSLMAQRSLLSFYDARSKGEYRVRDLIGDVIEIHRSRAEELKIEINVDTEPQSSVYVNAAEFHQLFSNLILNAMDAMECTGGQLSVCGTMENGLVKIEVGDTGKGIDEQHLESIFDPFFTTKGHIGTGLGLWVCKNIVETHGGKLTVRTNTSCDHHGTVLSFTLPTVKAAVAS